MFYFVCQTKATALMWAATEGHLPMVKFLIEKKANLNAKNNVHKHQPFTYVIINSYAVLTTGWQHGAVACDLEGTQGRGAASQGRWGRHQHYRHCKYPILYIVKCTTCQLINISK